MNAACKVMTQTTLRREHTTVFNPGKHSLSGTSLKVRKEDLVTRSTPDALTSDTFDDTFKRQVALWKGRNGDGCENERWWLGQASAFRSTEEVGGRGKGQSRRNAEDASEAGGPVVVGMEEGKDLGRQLARHVSVGNRCLSSSANYRCSGRTGNEQDSCTTANYRCSSL